MNIITGLIELCRNIQKSLSKFECGPVNKKTPLGKDLTIAEDAYEKRLLLYRKVAVLELYVGDRKVE
jgi:hypothetical protein